MAKRFTDTDKYKKPFIRGLKAPYKLLWDYLYHDCSHAGIWIKDFAVAQIYIGQDAMVNEVDALKFFNLNETRIIPFDNGEKWYIPGFIDFQYGKLARSNRAHNSVIAILEKNKLPYNQDFTSPPASPLQGDKDKDMDMDKARDMDKGIKGDARGDKFLIESAGKILKKHPKIVMPTQSEADVKRAIIAEFDKPPVKTIEAAVKYLMERTELYAAIVAQWPGDQQRFISGSNNWYAGGGYLESEEIWKQRIPAEKKETIPAHLRSTSLD